MTQRSKPLSEPDSTNISAGYCQCGCGQRTPLAKLNRAKNGWVKGQPVRFIRGHNKGRLGHIKRGPRYLEEDRGFESPCWIWQLNTLKNGYGLTWNGKRSTVAHRVYYEKAKGQIPGQLQLDHLCRVRNCVNPDHLEPVTNAENQRRGLRVTLTLGQAEEMRKRYACGNISQRKLAAQYKTHQATVWKIVHNKAWLP